MFSRPLLTEVCGLVEHIMLKRGKVKKMMMKMMTMMMVVLPLGLTLEGGFGEL